MLGLVLVITAATITCVSSCTFTSKVNMTSDKLVVTCRCETSRHRRPRSIQILETYHQRSFLLACQSLKSHKIIQGNYMVEESSISSSDNGTLAVLTLAFNPRKEYNLTCVFNIDDESLHYDLLYDPSEYLITHQKYFQMLIISIVTACSIIIVVTIIAVVIAKYRRPTTPAPAGRNRTRLQKMLDFKSPPKKLVNIYQPYPPGSCV